MRPTSSLGLATHSTSLLPRLPEEIPKITQATQHLTKENCDIDKLDLQNDSKIEQNSLRNDWLNSDWLPDSKIIRKTTRKSGSLALPAVEGMSFLIRGLNCLK